LREGPEGRAFVVCEFRVDGMREKEKEKKKRKGGNGEASHPSCFKYRL
jgi:hypothetical protein